MSGPSYGDVANAVKGWLLFTDIADLVKRADGGYSMYLAMPKAAPKPALTINLVGGGPASARDLPEVVSRLTFSCWGNTRNEAENIAGELVGVLENLSRSSSGVLSLGVVIYAAQVMAIRWLPDPDSDAPRYIVDALITTVTA